MLGDSRPYMAFKHAKLADLPKKDLQYAVYSDRDRIETPGSFLKYVFYDNLPCGALTHQTRGDIYI